MRAAQEKIVDIEISRLLTHFILNRLSHTTYWKSPISILGTSDLHIPGEKWLNYLQTVETDQTLHSAASDLGLH